MPAATAGAFPNRECTQASCHDDSGNGVEKTSRQPVALAMTILPSAARIAASSTNRAPSASPQPWQARWPEVIELDRPTPDWTERSSSASSRLPAAKVPIW